MFLVAMHNFVNALEFADVAKILLEQVSKTHLRLLLNALEREIHEFVNLVKSVSVLLNRKSCHLQSKSSMISFSLSRRSLVSIFINSILHILLNVKFRCFLFLIIWSFSWNSRTLWSHFPGADAFEDFLNGLGVVSLPFLNQLQI